MPWQFFTKTGQEKYSEPIAASAPLGASIIPGGPDVGIIVPFSGSSAPSGWLLCQGQELPISSYSDLASQLGTTYGALTNGSGAPGLTHFRLPDFRGRCAIGSGTLIGNENTGSGLITGSNSSIFSTGTASGSESVTLSGLESGAPSHSHSLTIPSHNHVVNNTNHSHQYGTGVVWSTTEYTITAPHPNSTARVTSYSSIGASLANSTTGISFSISSNVAASSSHENMQPYLVVNYIIKT